MNPDWRISFEVYGESFFPSRVDVPFARQHDPGAIGKIGRYRNAPVPYGTATYVVPDSVSRADAMQHLVTIFEPKLDQLSASGATEWHVSIARYYSAQCNEEYSLEELKLIMRLRCGFIYSAYITDDAESSAKSAKTGD